MIKEALQYIVGLKDPVIDTIDGQHYSDKPLIRVSHNPKAHAIEMSTLSSLIDYIKSRTDTMSEKMIVQVVSPLEVNLISMLDDDRIREELVCVRGQVPDYTYGRYMDNESFLVSLRAKFLPGRDREEVLKFAGTVKSGSVSEYGDDGVSQKATVKKGIAGAEDAIVPNPVNLCPYRTFVEVSQPESSFVFRMRDDGRGVECALFEADGGAWRNSAMKNVKEYLERELGEFPEFTVIS